MSVMDKHVMDLTPGEWAGVCAELAALTAERDALKLQLTDANKLLDVAFNNLTEFGGINDESRIGWWLKDYEKYLDAARQAEREAKS